MFYASACVPFRPFFYLTFAVSLFHISLFYGHLSCYLVAAFPAKNFGKLYTAALCLSSVPSLLVFPATIVTVRHVGFFNACLFMVAVSFAVVLFSTRNLLRVFRSTGRKGGESCRDNPAYSEEGF